MTTTPIETSTAGQQLSDPARQTIHRILLDSDVSDRTEWGQYRTPSALRQMEEDGRKKCKPTKLTITKSSVPFTKFARVDVDSQVTEESLTLRIQITCNPEHMCTPYDLVPVLLETRTDDFAFTIAVLEVTEAANRVDIEVAYSMGDLAIALGAQPGPKLKPLAAILEKYSELGVKAQWLANTTGGGNHANHVSGGVFEKGGSGRVILRPRTREQFEKTQGVRNLEWNMSERLTEGRARPVFQAFPDLLAEGKELATTIEAESEFLCSPEQLDSVIKVMDGLTAKMTGMARQGQQWPLHSANPANVVCSPMVSMTKETKVYTDIYYDLVGATVANPLLRNRIVLRRRKVTSDPDGTFLFTLKGATYQFGSEALRYAAQVNLIEGFAATPKGLLRVRDLMSDSENYDNAFATCFRSALAAKGLTELLAGPIRWTVAPVLTVRSERHKYSMKFDDNTVLDFSADTAVAEESGQRKSVCSFELGVGHPGLTTAGTATYVSMASKIAGWGAQGSWRQAADTGPRITRPFHVEADVANKRVLDKNDFKFYVVIREALLNEHLRLKLADLEPGGNKGSVLARALGLVRD